MKLTPQDLDDLEQKLGRSLPGSYRSYLELEGVGRMQTLSADYIEFWSPEEIIGVAGLPEVRDRFPEIVRFGGDGSREALAFDFRSDPPRVVLLDMTARAEEDLIEQGKSFEEFLSKARKQGLYWGQ